MRTTSATQLEKYSKLLVIILIFGLGVLGVYSAAGLFADGSFFLLRMLERKGYFRFDKTREFAQLVTQSPVVWAIKLGVRDLNLLIRTHSFGLIVIPLALWAYALKIQRHSELFWIFVLGFCLTFLSSGFYSIGEYNLAYALFALCASILLSQRIGAWHGILLIFSAIVLIKTYEVSLLLGPLLCAVSLCRYYRLDPSQQLERPILLLAASLFCGAALIAAESMIFPRDSGNMSEALNFNRIFLDNHFRWTASAFLAIAATMIIRTKWLLMMNLCCMGILMLFQVFVASQIIAPAQYYSFRSISGLLFGAVISFAALFYFFERFRALNPIRKESRVAIFCLYAVLVLSFNRELNGFYRWARLFETEANRYDTPISIEHTLLWFRNKKFKSYHWGWSNPSLSVLLRGSNTGIILNPQGATWQPFDPLNLKRNPLEDFQKDSLLYD